MFLNHFSCSVLVSWFSNVCVCVCVLSLIKCLVRFVSRRQSVHVCVCVRSAEPYPVLPSPPLPSLSIPSPHVAPNLRPPGVSLPSVHYSPLSCTPLLPPMPWAVSLHTGPGSSAAPLPCCTPTSFLNFWLGYTKMKWYICRGRRRAMGCVFIGWGGGGGKGREREERGGKRRGGEGRGGEGRDGCERETCRGRGVFGGPQIWRGKFGVSIWPPYFPRRIPGLPMLHVPWRRTVCCAKSRLFSTTCSQGPAFCTPDAVLNGSCTPL